MRYLDTIFTGENDDRSDDDDWIYLQYKKTNNVYLIRIIEETKYEWLAAEWEQLHSGEAGHEFCFKKSRYDVVDGP